MPIFSTKKKHFSYFKTTMILFDLILQFWRSTILLYHFSNLPSATNQQLFCDTESDIGHGPLSHTVPLYELLASTLSLNWALVKCQRHAAECIKNLRDTFHWDILALGNLFCFAFVFFCCCCCYLFFSILFSLL